MMKKMNSREKPMPTVMIKEKAMVSFGWRALFLP